jgi:hypothetical protein
MRATTSEGSSPGHGNALPDVAARWFGAYADAVSDALKAQGIARPPFEPLWWATTVALRGFLLDGPICDFEVAVRTRLFDLGYGFLFVPSELAGRGRSRTTDDPAGHSWGTGWAKKRWNDIKEGDFVPDPAPDTRLDTVAINPDELVPFCSRASWRWGDIADHGVGR